MRPNAALAGLEAQPLAGLPLRVELVPNEMKEAEHVARLDIDHVEVEWAAVHVERLDAALAREDDVTAVG